MPDQGKRRETFVYKGDGYRNLQEVNVRICHNEERKGYRPITVVFDYYQNKFDQYFRLVG